MPIDEPPTIEHDEGEFRRPILLAIWTARIQIVVLVGIGTLTLSYSRGLAINLWDAVFILLWLCLLAWCIVPSVSSIYPDSHESAGERFAFRMGKALHKVLHLGRRNTTIRD